MRVRLHPDARAELLEARKWYYLRSPLSSIAFSHAIDRAVSRIRDSPNNFPLADYGTRKVVLQRFPFNLVYRFDETGIVIVAVAHQKRRPGYWSNRVME